MQTIDEQAVGKLLNGITIPPCPAVLAALSREMRKDRINDTTVTRLISKDVALAAGVIKCANSPLFGTTRPLESVAEALRLLGFNNVLSLVINQLLQAALANGDGQPTLERFWDTATYTAGVCAQLARSLPGTKRETAYTFGLFHDCGLPLLMRRFEDYKVTLGLANQDTLRPFTQVEEERHGTNHAVIGYLLGRNWGLPENLTRAILCHHDFSVLETGELPGESCTLIGLGLVAERVVGSFLRVNAEEGDWVKGKAIVARYFGLSDMDLDDLVEDVLFKLNSARDTAA